MEARAGELGADEERQEKKEKVVWTESDDCILIDNYLLLKDLENCFELLGKMLKDPKKTKDVVSLCKLTPEDREAGEEAAGRQGRDQGAGDHAAASQWPDPRILPR